MPPTRMSSVLVLASAFAGAPLFGQDRPSPTVIANAVDSLAQRVMAAGLTPGLGVAIVMDGRTIFARNYGFADLTGQVRTTDRTLWYVASTSKSFTGFGIALLASQGVIDLNASIASLFPKARWHADVDPTRLTLANFLSHTHHLSGGAVVMNAAFTGAIAEARWPELLQFSNPTGSPDLVYSNLGYNVAAMVIDTKRPEGWRRYLENAVYKPAGLHETYARVSGLDRRRIGVPHYYRADGSFVTLPFFKTDATMNSAGGHVATIQDLARWVTVQMDSGVLEGRRVFPASAVALSHTQIAPHTVASSKRFAYFDRAGWGAGWDIGSYEGERMVSRFGSYSSTRSHLSLLPGRRIGVVAQVNGTPGWNATDLIAAFAYDLEAGRSTAWATAERRLQQLVDRLAPGRREIASGDSTRAARQRPMDRPLRDFTGTYLSNQLGSFTLELRGETLHYRWGVLYGPAEVFDAAKRQLRIEVVGSGNVVSFEFGETGPATAMQVSGATFTRQ